MPEENSRIYRLYPYQHLEYSLTLLTFYRTIVFTNNLILKLEVECSKEQIQNEMNDHYTQYATLFLD